MSLSSHEIWQVLATGQGLPEVPDEEHEAFHAEASRLTNAHARVSREAHLEFQTVTEDVPNKKDWAAAIEEAAGRMRYPEGARLLLSEASVDDWAWRQVEPPASVEEEPEEKVYIITDL